MAVELRWLERNPVPEGEAARVLQYRQTYIAPNMERFKSWRNIMDSAWVEKVTPWREVPVVKNGA